MAPVYTQDVCVLRHGVRGGHTVIFPHPVLVYKDIPARVLGRQWPF
jgi:hypothetical protein